jgi:hypothetical protein
MCAAPAMVSIGDHGVLNREVSQTLSDVWIDRDLSWLDLTIARLRRPSTNVRRYWSARSSWQSSVQTSTSSS